MSSLTPVDPFALAEAPLEPRAADASGPRREINLLALAWRGRWLILLLALVGGGVGWVVLQRTTPRYTSLSRIYVERSVPRILDEQMQMAQSVNYLNTQAELIRSSLVLRAAAELPENDDLESFRNVDDRVGFLKSAIKVAVGASDDIINVLAELPNAKDAAQIVNSVVNAYRDTYVDQHKKSAVEVLTILRNEKQRRDTELQQRRTELDDFRKKYPELAVQVAQDNVVTIRFAALSAELNSTELELLQAKARYNSVKKMYETPSQRPYLLEMAGAEQQALRDVELEREVKQLEQALVNERSQWGEGHPRVKLLADSLERLREELKEKQAAIVESYLESLRQHYELLDHKRSEVQAAYDRQFEAATRVSGLVVQLAALKDSYERTLNMCEILDERIKEVNLTEEAGSMSVNVLEHAVASSKQSYPAPEKFLTLGVLVGALVGYGLAWLRDLLDHRLRSVEEVSEVLQLPVLGVLPHLPGARASSHVGRLVAHAPRCSIAEAVRTLRTALHFGLAGHDSKTLCVTSPSPGDGKSTVASNLAIAMAQTDQRILLIDADMRKPTQHLIFEVDPRRGLASILADRGPFADAIVGAGVERLDLLPCGPLPANPVELLNNGFFAELLDELKTRYDKIIIDSPPVMPVADARVIAATSDATILVLRAERSPRRLSLAARNELWRVRAKRLGVVVNGVPAGRQDSYGYGYGYGYGPGDDDEPKLPPSRRKKSRPLPAPEPAPAAAGEEA
jgi:capsular exopolysaccharide synthesis family protein